MHEHFRVYEPRRGDGNAAANMTLGIFVFGLPNLNLGISWASILYTCLQNHA